MLPTMSASGDLVVIRRFGRTFVRGDVVVATSPTNPSTKLCKRIIGLPGDTVLINPHPYLPLPTSALSTVTVPPGHVFLQGDNVANSSDSRHYGPVPTALVMGKVVAKVWPVGEWGAVERTMRWSGQPQWVEEEEREGLRERRQGRKKDKQVDEEEDTGGLRPRLPGRGGALVMAERPQEDQVRSGEGEAVDVRWRELNKQSPQITIIPFTPAASRARPAVKE